MRYYRIVITPPGGGPATIYTSHPNGTNNPPDPGALNVELDILQYVQNTPGGGSFLRIWGVSLMTMAQASQLNNQTISIYGGMGKGLPLANPQQAGLLAQGTVAQAFSNWQGVNQTLEINFWPALASAQGADIASGSPAPAVPAPIALNWQPQQPLAAALKPALAAAFPNYRINVNISPNLVIAAANPHYCGSLVQLAQWLQPVSQTIIGGNYSGVMLSVHGNQINAFDSTAQPGSPTAGAVKMIEFNDLIGQVTWIEPQTIQAQCVMRGDLSIGQIIKMPPGQIATTSQSYSQFRQASAIQGQFLIQKIRHIGSFRQADGASWATIVEAVVNVP
jgi:hypothetical protein